MFRETGNGRKPGKNPRRKLHPSITGRGRHLVMVPGVRIAARELGCSFGHLHGVVTGKRISRGLLARYEAWLSARKETLS